MLKIEFQRDVLIAWLREENPLHLAELFGTADAVRMLHVGDAVHLRALVEISNRCVRQCGYCGLRAGNLDITRYRMSADEILGCARQAVAFGYGTIVMQAGEDPGLRGAWMADVIRRIKSETPLAVTLSLGERSDADLELWKRAGADRYLLRFETSDRALFDRIHPPRPGQCSDRIALLRRMREMGYEIGSGIMVGMPGQTLASVADDILLFRELDLDMVGIGPYIAHPETPLGREGVPLPATIQCPGDERFVYKAMALTRLACPHANIPSTTALATINTDNGRELGLMRGANVVMPNLTPSPYRQLYQIYPGKACITEDAAACNGCLKGRIRSIDRTVGTGPGGRRRMPALAEAGHG